MANQKKEGSVLGGMLLIAGSCIGAGMLGLPILTGVAGFFPSLIMFSVAWIFMTMTALLLVEINTGFQRRVNLLTMVGHTLGGAGRLLSWFLYLFLFYALLVAYMSASGNHVAGFMKSILHVSLPDWLGSFFFVAVFGWLIYLGTRSVDWTNRALMFVKIAAYLCLVFSGIEYVKTENLLQKQIEYAFFSLPILVISFGFHNMIPSLTSYLGGDVKRVKKAIIGGSFFVLVVYLIWEIIALGILPMEGENGIFWSFGRDIDAAAAIKNFLQKKWVGIFAQLLAFFAILTSFLAQSLSLAHFLGDGMNVKHGKRENPWMCLIALGPPLILSIVYPQLFFKALNFAGGICAVLIFGVFPALMVWRARYKKKLATTYHVFGGRAMLVFVLCFALFIFFYQLSIMLGLKWFPQP